MNHSSSLSQPAENAAPRTVLVTGAAGYLASWIVLLLLQAGHRVHGTVRNLGDRTKLAHLLTMSEDYPGQLHLYEADLMKEGSFDVAMQQCSGVIHAASPYFLNPPKDAQRDLVLPAVEGTRNVLASVNRCASVERVVLTSSVVTLYGDACDVGPQRQHTVRESDFNLHSSTEHSPYAHSKTLAEQLAWQMKREQSRWDLISVHPGAIFGPSLSKRVDASSVSMVVQFLKGAFKSGVPKLWLGVVDVRDVAFAHVSALLEPTAHGRYLVVAKSLRLLEMSAEMRLEGRGIPDKLPRSEAPKWLMWLIGPMVGLQRRYVTRNVGHPLQFDASRTISELRMRWRSPAETLNDQISQIVKDGLLDAGAA